MPLNGDSKTPSRDGAPTQNGTEDVPVHNGTLRPNEPMESDPCIGDNDVKPIKEQTLIDKYVQEVGDRTGLSRKGVYVASGVVIFVIVLLIIVIALGAAWPKMPHKYQYPVCGEGACLRAAAQISENMNKSVLPCDNLWTSVCGGWLKNHPLPIDKSIWNPKQELIYREAQKVRDLIATLPLPLHTLTVEWKLKHFYESCLDVHNINLDNARPLTNIISELGFPSDAKANVVPFPPVLLLIVLVTTVYARRSRGASYNYQPPNGNSLNLDNLQKSSQLENFSQQPHLGLQPPQGLSQSLPQLPQGLQQNFPQFPQNLPQGLPQFPQGGSPQFPQGNIPQFPQGLPQLPQGLPQLPQGLPQQPQGLPQLPHGNIPQFPQGLPQLPQGLPQLPQQPQGLPQLPQGNIPQFPQGLPQLPQGLPQLPQDLPQQPQGLPQLPQDLPQLRQELPQLPQGLPQLPQNPPQLPQILAKEIPQGLPQLPQNFQQGLRQDLPQFPQGIRQLPQNLPPPPQNLPELPQNLPQLPQNLPQLPQGFPQGFPQLPQGLPQPTVQIQEQEISRQVLPQQGLQLPKFESYNFGNNFPQQQVVNIGGTAPQVSLPPASHLPEGLPPQVDQQINLNQGESPVLLPGPEQSHGGVLVTKHVYFHVAPEEPEEYYPPKHIPVAPARKHYKIIFIKAPSGPNPTAPSIPLQPQNEERTIVYVLVRRPEQQPDIVVPTQAPTQPSKPEVYFIRYKAPKENQGSYPASIAPAPVEHFQIQNGGLNNGVSDLPIVEDRSKNLNDQTQFLNQPQLLQNLGQPISSGESSSVSFSRSGEPAPQYGPPAPYKKKK